jgi:hypothetical protein
MKKQQLIYKKHWNTPSELVKRYREAGGKEGVSAIIFKARYWKEKGWWLL